MSDDHSLDWEGCWNARDLGGLMTSAGRLTVARRVVRSEELTKVTPRGWDEIVAYGIATIVDLRDLDEADADLPAVPGGIERFHVPIEEGLDGDEEFAAWRAGKLLATPIYHRRFLERWPDRCVLAIEAVASAPPGGVIVCCGKGCDRTGLISMLLLDLAGVLPEEIASDFELTRVRLASERALSLGRADDSERIDAVLRDHGYSTQREVLLETLSDLHAEELLRRAGLPPERSRAVRSRLLDDSGT